jgi:tetratricopeptide (TPR) repeat protein
MLHDRPAMAKYGENAKVLYEWAAQKFAGEDSGRKIFWDASEPPPHTTAVNNPFPVERPAIMVSSKCPAGPNKGEDRPFDELWCNVVYELYNVANAKDFLRLDEMAAENKLAKTEFVNGTIECESRAAEKTRAFYIHVYLPWARIHDVSTHPTSWFLAWRSDPKDGLLRRHFTEKESYWRYYERCYNLIVLDSLTRKGENERAAELATEALKQAETPEERATICLYSGHCLLRLNKPIPAIDTYSEVIRFDPQNALAFLGRATAYGMLHDTERAMADYAEAIRLKPSNPDAYLLRGKAYKAMGDKDRANADFAMAKQLTSGIKK